MAERCSGARVHVHGSEAAMLRAWHAHVMAVDPDALVVYEARRACRPCSGSVHSRQPSSSVRPWALASPL